jgi:hypothetical protein
MKKFAFFFTLFSPFAFIVIFTSACVDSGQRTEPVKASIPTPLLTATQQPTQTSTAQTTNTLHPTETPFPTATFTAVPTSPVLLEFPLVVGASWQYAVEITSGDNAAIKDPSQLSTWSGYTTALVTGRRETSDGKIIFTIKQGNDPTPSNDYIVVPSYEYTVYGDGVYKDENKILQFPLSDGLRWDWFEGYTYFASYQEEVETPYGKYKGCYVIWLVTLSSTSSDTFCPNVGFVKHEYEHHGTPHIENYVLISFTPGQK